MLIWQHEKKGSSFGPTSVTADVSWGNTRVWPPPPLTKTLTTTPVHTHAHNWETFFLSPSLPAASLDRKPQFPLLHLWAPLSLHPIAFVFLLYSPPSALHPFLSFSHLLPTSCLAKLFKPCCHIATFIFTISRSVNSLCRRVCKLNVSPSNCCIKANIIAHNIM